MVSPIFPIVIGTASECSIGGSAFQSLGFFAYPSANRCIFIPFTLSTPFIARQLWVYNATGSVSGNLDLGIYDSTGTLLVSTGSTPAAINLQYIDIDDTLIGPGQFYFAVTVDNGGSNMAFGIMVGGLGAVASILGILKQEIFPLPDTATFASQLGDFVQIPYIGATGYAA